LKAAAITLKEKIWRDALLVGEPGELVKLLNSKAALEQRVAILGDKLQGASDVYALFNKVWVQEYGLVQWPTPAIW
jgi:hypothetical protein